MVNEIRDGRASFREEKLAKDLSWRAGELEILLSAVLYFFAKDGGTPCDPTTSGPAQLAVFDIACPASKFSIRGVLWKSCASLRVACMGAAITTKNTIMSNSTDKAQMV